MFTLERNKKKTTSNKEKLKSFLVQVYLIKYFNLKAALKKDICNRHKILIFVISVDCSLEDPTYSSCQKINLSFKFQTRFDPKRQNLSIFMIFFLLRTNK